MSEKAWKREHREMLKALQETEQREAELSEVREFPTWENFRQLTVDAGYYDVQGDDKGPHIIITCTDKLNRVHDVEPGEQYAPLTPSTARDLAAHLISLADKLEGKAE